MNTTVITDGGDTPAVVPVETSEAAVEIAQIEADRDVAIAEISAETTTELAETAQDIAEIEADEAEDLEQWLDARLQELEGRVNTTLMLIQEQHNQMLAMLTSLLILIPPSIPQETTETELTTETATEPDSAAGGAREDRETVVRARNWL